MRALKSLVKSAMGPRQVGIWRRMKWRVRPPERELAWLSRLVRICALKGSFIDIGAHLGLYSVTTARVFETVLGIEANPSVCEAWIASGLPKNVAVENLAISDEAGYAELRMPIIRGSGIANLGEATIAETNDFAGDGYSGCETVQVRCTSLDNLVAEKYSHWQVVAIKIDVEGHEEKVIEGAIQTISKVLPLLLIEMEYRHGANVEKLFDQLETLGYVALRVSKSGSRLIPTTVGEIRELQSNERWEKKKKDLYCADYVNNFFFLPGRLESKLRGVISAVDSL